MSTNSTKSPFSFTDVINESTLGQPGTHSQWKRGITETTHIAVAGNFREHLHNHLIEHGTECILWRGEELSADGYSFIFSNKEKSGLVDWSGFDVKQFKARLISDVAAFYKIQAAQRSLVFGSEIVPICPRDFIMNTSAGLVTSMINYLRCKLADELLSAELLSFDESYVLRESIGFYYDSANPVQPRDLMELDVDAIWKWLVDHADVDLLNKEHKQKLAGSLTDAFVQKKEYKAHATIKLSLDGERTLNSVTEIIGKGTSFEVMGLPNYRYGDAIHKLKLDKNTVKEITIFLNLYAKDALTRSLDLLERGML